jgi:hypothetical protein
MRFGIHFGESAIKAFSKGNTYPVSHGVYHWWYTIGFRTIKLYLELNWFMLLSSALLFAGWLHLQFVQAYLGLRK